MWSERNTHIMVVEKLQSGGKSKREGWQTELPRFGLGRGVIEMLENEKTKDAAWQGRCSGTVYIGGGQSEGHFSLTNEAYSMLVRHASLPCIGWLLNQTIFSWHAPLGRFGFCRHLDLLARGKDGNSLSIEDLLTLRYRMTTYLVSDSRVTFGDIGSGSFSWTHFFGFTCLQLHQ